MIQSASAQLKEAKEAIASTHASELSAERALSAAGKAAAAASGPDILSLQPQAVEKEKKENVVHDTQAPESAAGDGQTEVKESSPGSSGAPAGAVRKRRRTADLLSHLDSISRDI